MKTSLVFVLVILCASAAAQERHQFICSYAPSQSAKVAAIAGVATGGAAATAGAVAAAAGLTAVLHSSGAYILSGAGGYIAGTIGGAGTAMAAAPFIVTAGILVGGAAVSVELVCASKNHPHQVAKIEAAGQEFASRFRATLGRAKVATVQASKSVRPSTVDAAAKVKRVTGNVWRYAFRRRATDSRIVVNSS